MNDRRMTRVGLSLLPIGNRSGTGFYARQVLRILLARQGKEFRTVPIIPKDSTPDWDNPGTAIKTASRYSLRWPFRFGSRLASRGFLRGLDLLHYPNGIGPPQGTVPTVATLHDVSPYLCPETLPFSRALFLRKMFSATAATAQVVLTDSHWQAERVRKVFPHIAEKIRVLYPISDPIFGRPGTPDGSGGRYSSDRRFVLMVGTLEPRKNIESALAEWGRSGFDADLYLVGRWGWKREPLLARLNSLGRRIDGEGGIEAWELEDGRRIYRLGFVSKERLAALYRRAFCLLYPSKFEGFGLPVLEAMKSACPIVTRPESAMAEVAGKAGWYFDPEKPGSLSEALVSILKDPQERLNRVAVGEARAGLFNDDSFYDGLCAAYRKALENTTSSR